MMGRRSDRQTAENVIVLINRIATEVAHDEATLRGRIAGLLDDGRINDAQALLRAWDVMAAGDVLKKHAGIRDGHKG